MTGGDMLYHAGNMLIGIALLLIAWCSRKYWS